MRKRRELQTEGSVSCGARAPRRRVLARRRLWAVLLALILPLVLVLTALLAPIGQAHPARERTPEEESARAAAKRAEREAHSAERRAQREQLAGAKRTAGGGGTVRENGAVQISCTQVVWSYDDFPELPGNTVTERLAIGHQAPTVTSFSFDGATGTDVMAIDAPPGSYHIDAWAKWKTNGVHGSFDIPVVVKCAPAPALAVEKLQKIEGTGASYTSSPLMGLVGQTVAYEILVHNTGNVPLALASFTDSRCDPGTISGGPSSAQVAAGATTTYLCTHRLGPADRSAGSYSNTVSVNATPPSGEGSPVSQTSNTVVVEVPAESPPGGEEQPSTTSTNTTSPTSTSTPASSGGASSTLANTITQLPRSGVLAFSAASIPHLSAPQGCLRMSFHASVKAAGVASVIFYLDGHKLRRLTAHSAKGGLLRIAINPSGWSVGAHRLLARITMVKAPGAAKAVTGSRSKTLLRCHSAALTPKFTG